MHIAFLNPQGNFDAADSHLTAHPDFGGQLVYVKQVALALGRMGHRVDIVTRRIVDPEWPEFASELEWYPGKDAVRIVRLRCGPDDRFLRKEDLWPHLVRDWVPSIAAFYDRDEHRPDALTGHYGDGGLAAALWHERTGTPFTFTAHSLGAHKLDKLVATAPLEELDAGYRFGVRLAAERVAMSRAGVVVTSTRQERFEQYRHPAYAGVIDVTDDRRFEIVPPGVDLAVFDRDARIEGEDRVRVHVDACLRRDLGPRAGLPSIVASSRLEPKKNIVGLVEAYASSPALQDHANLVLVTGALDDPLRTDEGARPDERAVLAAVRGVVDAADLGGKVSAFALRGQAALAAAYRHLTPRRSVFALTALYEPFGLAPLEAAATGLPVVVTRNGGPTESLVDADGEYGVLVDPADPASIAAGLERALGAEWDRLHVAGHARVLARYTWERTAAGYLRAISRILDSATDAPAAPDLHPYFADPDAAPAPRLAPTIDSTPA